MVLVEFFYLFKTGCTLSEHMKIPLVIRRIFRFVGVYATGLLASLLVAQTGKMFVAWPRPYFISICRPMVANCTSATLAVCAENDTDVLVDAATSFPSLPTAASSFSSLYIAMYFHAMLGSVGAYVIQPLIALLLFLVTVLASLVEYGCNRSRWMDIVAGDVIGLAVGVYLVVAVVNCFQERLKPVVKAMQFSVEVQVNIESSPPTPVFQYEQITGPQSFPRRVRRLSEEKDVHRDASWDTSFQKDLVRSLEMYKKFNEKWASSAPVITADRPFYESLPGLRASGGVGSDAPPLVRVTDADGRGVKDGVLAVPRVRSPWSKAGGLSETHDSRTAAVATVSAPATDLLSPTSATAGRGQPAIADIKTDGASAEGLPTPNSSPSSAGGRAMDAVDGRGASSQDSLVPNQSATVISRSSSAGKSAAEASPLSRSPSVRSNVSIQSGRRAATVARSDTPSDVVVTGASTASSPVRARSPGVELTSSGESDYATEVEKNSSGGTETKNPAEVLTTASPLHTAVPQVVEPRHEDSAQLHVIPAPPPLPPSGLFPASSTSTMQRRSSKDSTTSTASLRKN